MCIPVKFGTHFVEISTSFRYWFGTPVWKTQGAVFASCWIFFNANVIT